MSKGGGGSTTVQKADPWSGQQPYLYDTFAQAQKLFQNPPSYYPNATYVPFSQQTEQALGRAENRAMGSPVESAFNNYLQGTLGGGGPQGDYLSSLMGTGGISPLQQTASGDFLNSNPYLDAMYGEATRNVTDRFNEAVAPSINATFGAAGRTGSGTHGLTMGRAAGDLADALAGMGANIYGGNYAAERANQLGAANSLNSLGLGAAGEMNRGLIGAASMVPNASALDWQNIAQLGNVGGQVEGMAGNILSDSMNRYNFGQNRMDDALARYVAAIQGNYGGQSLSQQDRNGNPIAGAAGGALTGAALSPMISNAMGGAALGPWGMIGGALLGALMS